MSPSTTRSRVRRRHGVFVRIVLPVLGGAVVGLVATMLLKLASGGLGL